jgi:hypothetical protein
MTSSRQNAPAELLPALTAAMHEAARAIAKQDLLRLEEIVQRQQELAAQLAKCAHLVRESAQEYPNLARELTNQSSILSRVIGRCAGTIRALSAISASLDSLYSLQSLPRR